MTDNEINRLVAERVMGWQELYPDFDGFNWQDAAGRLVLHYQFCTDPAAWGALFEHLTRAGRQPSLEGYENFGYTAEVCPEGGDHGTPMNDALPGRALALAALKAYGVTIE